MTALLMFGALGYAGVAAYALKWFGEAICPPASRMLAMVLVAGCADHLRRLMEALA